MKKMRRTFLCFTLALLMTLSVCASSFETADNDPDGTSSLAPGTTPPTEDVSDGVWDGQSDGGPETPIEEWTPESHDEGEERSIVVARADGKRESAKLDRPEDATIWAAAYGDNEKTLEILVVEDNQVTVGKDARRVRLFTLGENGTPLGTITEVSFRDEAGDADAQSGVQEAAPDGVAAPSDEMSADAIGSWLYSGQRYNIVSAIDTSYAVDLNGNSVYNGSNIQLYKSNWSWAQDFRIQYVKYYNGRNCYKIVHTSSGMVLDASASSWNDNGGNNVILYQYHGGANQLWSFERSGSGYRIRNMYRSNFYLDASGGVAGNYVNVQVYPKNGTRAQLWYLDNVCEPQVRFVDSNNWPISRVSVSPGKSASVKFQFRGTNIQALDVYQPYLRFRYYHGVSWPSAAGNTGYGYLYLARPSGDWRSCTACLRMKVNNAYRASVSLYLP